MQSDDIDNDNDNILSNKELCYINYYGYIIITHTRVLGDNNGSDKLAWVHNV